jgi:hypothetical protein
MAVYPSGLWHMVGLNRTLCNQIVTNGPYINWWNTTRQIAYFGNSSIEASSGIPMNTVGTPVDILLPLVGGEMELDGTGDGDLAGNLVPSYPMEIDFTGSGDLDATAALVVSMALAATGSGTLTATITGRLNASVGFTGSGDLDASMTALGNMIAALTGSGDLDATISAFGDMEIDIVVTGTGLTTANVGSAVWQTILESGVDSFTASRILRIIAAAAAGGVSGGPGSPAQRNLSDTQDQITGTADADGDRSGITYGP